MISHQLSYLLRVHADKHELKAVVERLLSHKLRLQIENYLGGGLDKRGEIFLLEDFHESNFFLGVKRDLLGGSEPKSA